MGVLRRRGKAERLRDRGETAKLGKILHRRSYARGADGRALDLDAIDKIEAAQALEELSSEDSVENLTAGLSSPEPAVRAAVIDALAAVPGDPARDTLLAVVGDRADAQDDLGRSSSLQALIRRNDVAPVDVVGALTRRQDDLVIDVEHKAFVTTALDGASPDARRAVTETLVEDLTHGSEPTRARSRELLVSLGEGAVDPALDAMRRPESRQEAAVVLGRLRSSRATPALVDALEDEAPGVRAAAAWALGEIRDPAAVERLTFLTGDDSYEVRVAASSAINQFGNVAVLAHVTSLLRPVVAELERTNPDANLPALPGAYRQQTEAHAGDSSGLARQVLGRLGLT